MKNKENRKRDWGEFFGNLFGKGSEAKFSQKDVIRNAENISAKQKQILLNVLEEQEESASVRFKENLKALKESNTRSALSRSKVNYKSEVNKEQKSFNKGEISD